MLGEGIGRWPQGLQVATRPWVVAGGVPAFVSRPALVRDVLSLRFGETGKDSVMTPLQNALARFLGLDPEKNHVTLSALRTAFLDESVKLSAQVMLIRKTTPDSSMEALKIAILADRYDARLRAALKPFAPEEGDPDPDLSMLEETTERLVNEALEVSSDPNQLLAPAYFVNVVKKLGLPLAGITPAKVSQKLDQMTPAQIREAFQLEVTP